VKPPELPKAPDSPPKLDLSKYAGTYRRLHMDTELTVKDGNLVGLVRYTGPLQGLGEPQEFAVTPLDPENFLTGGGEGIAEFMDFDASGRPRYVHMGGRVARRAAGGGAASRRRPQAKKKSSVKKKR
jgi:hypothetical protein